jgi:hypothetical protein
MSTERKPIIVRITAADAPRDTIVALLQRSRQGRGKASALTQVHDGYLYAVIDHPGTAATFEAVLTELVIGHAQVDALPRKPVEAQPATASSASGPAFHRPGQRVWTGDARVDEAISNALVDTLTPSVGLFGNTSFGSVRVFR